MSTVLNYSPGQQATIVFEVLNTLGERSDGYDGYEGNPGIPPQITRIIFPNLSLAGGYPQNMMRLDVGLFMAQFTLPVLASSVGTYIVDILYYNPDIPNQYKNTFVQVICTAPFGQYTAGTF
jgi:hypothetical protein